MDILFVASKLADINSYTDIVEKGGLNAVIIDVKCFALKSAVDQINQISGTIEDSNLTAVLEFGLDENYVMILYENNRERRLGQRAHAVDRSHRGQAVLPQGGAHRGDQSRPRDHDDQHGGHAARQGEPGLVAELRAGEREPRASGVPGAALPGHGQGPGPASLLAALGLGLPPAVPPGRAAAPGREPGALPAEPAGGGRRHPTGAPRRPREAQRSARRRHG